MKIRLLLSCLVFVGISSFAQKKAVTENGDEVILYENGTWAYSKTADTATKVIEINPTNFSKPQNVSFLLKSNKCKVGVWFDPKKWSFEKPKDGGAAEYEFELKQQDLYGMLITEKIEIPLQSLKTLAIDNAREVASDITVTHEEYRMVNGLKMLAMQMTGTIKGIKFVYFGYYYSFEGGTIQFVTYTSQSLLKTYIKDAEELLNGFVTITE